MPKREQPGRSLCTSMVPSMEDKISVDRDALALAEPPPLVLRQNVDAFGTGVLEEELPD